MFAKTGSGLSLPARWVQRLRALLRDERGISLVLSLVIVAVLTISTTAVAQMIVSNEHAFGRDRQEALAFNSAEAGLNYGISYLASKGDPNGSAAIGTSVDSAAVGSVPSGTYTVTWRATKTGAHEWTIWGDAASPNGKVVRELSVKVVSATQPGTVTPASLAWSYGLFIANPGASCFTPQGTTDLTISIYVNGCLKLSGSAGIAEPSTSTGPSIKVFAATTISIQGNSAKIGSSTKPILSAIAPEGCTGSKGVICSQTPTSKVWATEYTGASTNLTKPVLYPDGVYALADWVNGPVCTGTGYPVFDTDGTRNTSAPSPNLFPATSYSCTIYAGSSHAGTPVGTLSWNAATSVLTATGTLFFDSNLDMNNTALSYSQGTSATFYFDGTVTVNGNAAFCGPPSVPDGSTCEGDWDSSEGAIVIAAVNHGNASPAWRANGNAEYDVAAYVVGNYQNNGSAKVMGPVVTDTATVSGSGSSTDVLDPPPSAPGGASTSPGSTTWGVIPGTWQQLVVN